VQVSPLALYPGTRLFDRYRAEGRISREFYRRQGDAEIFARQDTHTEKALRALYQAAQAVKPKARYSPAEFAEQKRWLGFCAVTNLLCGEAAEDEGRFAEAADEYAEIILKEPQNPWGWLKRALLRERTGSRKEAQADLAEVLALAPGNPEATELAATWGARRPQNRRHAHGPTAELKGAEAYLKRPTP
jgi:tetratricopeptide (TPR) repeat protein